MTATDKIVKPDLLHLRHALASFPFSGQHMGEASKVETVEDAVALIRLLAGTVREHVGECDKRDAEYRQLTQDIAGMRRLFGSSD